MFTSPVYHVQSPKRHLRGLVLCIAFTALTASIFGVPFLAYATPPADAIVNAGDTIYDQRTIKNTSSQTIEYQLDTTLTDQEQESKESTLPIAFNPPRWIQIEPNRLTLTAGASQRITVKVTIPEQAEPGLHNLTLRGYRSGTQNVTKQQVLFSETLNLQVIGETKTNVELQAVTIPPRYRWGELSFLQLQFSNTGATVRGVVSGTIQIAGIRRRDVIAIPTSTVLPEDTIRLQIGLPDQLKPGIYRISGSVIVAGADGNKEITLPTKSIWVLPSFDTWSTLGLLTALAAAILGVRYALLAAKRQRRKW